MWSVNTSVARVVISFTVLGTLFYVEIVVAGTSSYESPFQMPASTALRHLRDSGRTRKFLAVSHHVYDIPRYETITHPTSPDRLIARFLGNARRRLGQGVRRSRRTGPLQITIQDTNTRPIAPRNRPGLRAHVWNLQALRKQNVDNARCVCWVLRS